MSGTDPTMQPSRTGGGAGGDCPGEPFTTVLASPDPAAVATLSVGEQLTVGVVSGAYRAVVVYTAAGAYVGAITRDPARLAVCIDLGSTYTASVTDVSGGAVTVYVSGV